MILISIDNIDKASYQSGLKLLNFYKKPHWDFIVLRKFSILLQVLKFSECKIKFIITLGGVKSFIS